MVVWCGISSTSAGAIVRHGTTRNEIFELAKVSRVSVSGPSRNAVIESHFPSFAAARAHSLSGKSVRKIGNAEGRIFTIIDGSGGKSNNIKYVNNFNALVRVLTV